MVSTHDPSLRVSERLVRALQSPAAYGHPVEAVQTIETHISWVLLTGEFAYKIKKPIDLGFLDFSTLARREHLCHEEVRLNRRLAPQVYVGVAAIGGTRDAPQVDGPGEPVEYAVQMRQFSQDALLSRVLQRGELQREHIDEPAATIAEFHGSIAVASPDSPFGLPELVWRPMQENFEHLDLEPESSGAAQADRLREWSRAEFLSREDQFLARKRDGFVRECHGDMHAGNMLLDNGRVVIFDCIEFNESLRWIDVLSEAAFTVMDLEDRGRPELAHRLLNAYLERTGDYSGLGVFRFYTAYRALVRAKVASIRAAQDDVAAPERERLTAELHGYLDLAERYSSPAQPVLIITHGPSGSGKTTLTQPLLEKLGAIRLRSDVERKRLFGLPPLSRSGATEGASVYTTNATDRTYARLLEEAETILHAGRSVIVDATFLQRRRREAFAQLAARLEVPFAILDFQFDPEALRRRIERRIQEGRDASDADLKVLERQLQTREPLEPAERRIAVTHDPESAAERIAEGLQDLLEDCA